MMIRWVTRAGVVMAALSTVFANQTPVFEFDANSFAFVRAIERVMPAVVSIETITLAVGTTFLGQYQRLITQGGTSGFIVHPDGYAVTLYDQVKDAQSLQVALYDGRRFPGRLVGYDKWNNLAVIQILGKTKFRAVTFGSVNDLRVGETIIGLGFPIGETVSATFGIVSAFRDYPMWDFVVPKAIQTDAKFYQYNRGGPLINVRGEVIGMNAFSSEDYSLLVGLLPGSVLQDVQGLNFGFPADLLQEYTRQIIAGEKIYHPWLGLIATNANPTLRVYGCLPENLIDEGVGIMVDLVDFKGPAAKQGIRLGDILIGARQVLTTEQGDQVLDEILLKTPLNLASLVRNTPVGGRVRLTFVRECKIQTVDIYPYERPDDSTVGSF
ncbi:MAG: S1C family serine protease [bacterium JZ-2024 1]